jgi:hypothetical protein
MIDQRVLGSATAAAHAQDELLLAIVRSENTNFFVSEVFGHAVHNWVVTFFRSVRAQL